MFVSASKQHKIFKIIEQFTENYILLALLLKKATNHEYMSESQQECVNILRFKQCNKIDAKITNV